MNLGSQRAKGNENCSSRRPRLGARKLGSGPGLAASSQSVALRRLPGENALTDYATLRRWMGPNGLGLRTSCWSRPTFLWKAGALGVHGSGDPGIGPQSPCQYARSCRGGRLGINRDFALEGRQSSTKPLKSACAGPLGFLIIRRSDFRLMAIL